MYVAYTPHIVVYLVTNTYTYTYPYAHNIHVHTHAGTARRDSTAASKKNGALGAVVSAVEHANVICRREWEVSPLLAAIGEAKEVMAAVVGDGAAAPVPIAPLLPRLRASGVGAGEVGGMVAAVAATSSSKHATSMRREAAHVGWLLRPEISLWDLEGFYSTIRSIPARC